MIARAIRIFFVAMIIFPVAGCGYQQSGDYNRPVNSGYQWHSLYREDVQSVAVPIFANKDYHRGVEFSLTKAIVSQMEAHTPYKVIPKDRADTILEGEIVSITLRTISSDPTTALPQEQLMIIRVNFTWKDLRTGKILVERRNFDQTAPFYPTLGENQYVGSQEASEALALGIVQELQADW